MTTRDARRRPRLWLAFWVGALLVAGTPGPGQAQTAYETLPTLAASALLPADVIVGPFHRVADAVRNDGYMNHYTVTSRFGDQAPSSTALLRIRVGEINAIAALERVEASDEFKKAFEERAGKVVQGLGDLVTKPGETLSGAASGVSKAFERAGESLFGSQRSQAEEQRWKDLVGFAKTKREYARHFGVDVYSSNRALQERLDRLAWAGYAGGLSMGAVTALVPGGVGLVLSVQGTTTLLNEMLATTPPTDLRRINRDKLRAMGVDGQLAELFVNNTVLSPRHQTLTVAALDELRGTADRAAFVRFAVTTATEDLALFRQRMAELYAGYHRNVGPLERFVPVGGFVAARSRAGALVVTAPVDHLVWTEATARVLRAFAERAPTLQAKERQLWLGGTASPAALGQLRQDGWTVRESSEARLLARRP